jgi:hypothetical protein
MALSGRCYLMLARVGMGGAGREEGLSGTTAPSGALRPVQGPLRTYY